MKLKDGESSYRGCETPGLLVESGPLAYRSCMEAGVTLGPLFFFNAGESDFLSCMKVI